MLVGKQSFLCAPDQKDKGLSQHIRHDKNKMSLECLRFKLQCRFHVCHVCYENKKKTLHGASPDLTAKIKHHACFLAPRTSPLKHVMKEENVKLKAFKPIGCIADDRQTRSATRTCLTNTPRDAEPFWTLK